LPPRPPPLPPFPPAPPLPPPSAPPTAPPYALCDVPCDGFCWMQATACPTICTDTCTYRSDYSGYYASNGLCDDGGPGSEYTRGELCPIGSDCTDCGPRLNTSITSCSLTTPAGSYCIAAPGFCGLSTTLSNCAGSSVYYAAYSTISPPPSPPPAPPTPPPSPFPAAPPLSACDAGQTCGMCFMLLPRTDCPTLCTDTCTFSTTYPAYYASNGLCDDGGPGSEYSRSATYCPFGSDCSDCGPRIDASSLPVCSASFAGPGACVANSSDCGLDPRAMNCDTFALYTVSYIVSPPPPAAPPPDPMIGYQETCCVGGRRLDEDAHTSPWTGFARAMQTANRAFFSANPEVWRQHQEARRRMSISAQEGEAQDVGGDAA